MQKIKNKTYKPRNKPYLDKKIVKNIFNIYK